MMKGAGQEVFMQLMKNHGLFDNLVFSTNLEGRNRKPLALVPTTSSSSSVSSIPCSVSTSSKKLTSNDVVDGHQATRKRNGSKSVEQPRIPTLSPKQCHKTIGISERQTEGPSTTGNVIIVGVCAMAKKSQSRPMKEILARLERKFEDITVTIFPQDIILREPVEKWPVCDCLIAFHSDGFPLDKAAAYVNSRRPFVINDIDAQYVLLDRRKVYEILHREKVSFPRHIIVSRGASGGSGGDDQPIFESSNHVVINGHTFSKPFVEKPVSAEDHNVYIYYPDRDGGGSQRLFRKIGGWSSVHSNESQIRKTGSFIYEDYIQTNGQDVKVYTVGPDYAHAEARKSPALDGRVERDSEGREIRYPVVLTQDEKLIAKKICLAFKQTICGFDLLRTSDGKSIVCDVNGFSFVKNSTKYYDDCASILGAMIVREMDQRRGKLLKSVTTTLDSKCQFDLSSK